MLVPVQGGTAELQKRNRSILEQQAALSTVPIPSVYIYNIGPRPWTGVGGGKSWLIPACKKGERYSQPVAVPAICLSERDLADGGNNMDTVIDAAMSGSRTVGNQTKHIMGVADDILGKNSTSPGLSTNTTNGEWFGIFISQHLDKDGEPVPTAEELDEAEGKRRQMMQLIYAQGAEKVQAGEKVSMMDRPLYNEAAAYLGAKPLWGNLDHTRASCPECHEDIIEGAHFCKHCQQAIDPASVAGRSKKREREAAKMLKEEEATE